jgi:hypothetical protein
MENIEKQIKGINSVLRMLKHEYYYGEFSTVVEVQEDLKNEIDALEGAIKNLKILQNLSDILTSITIK